MSRKGFDNAAASTEAFLVDMHGDKKDDNKSTRSSFYKWLHEELSWNELRSVVIHMHVDEYDLLREMIQQQSPLPITIHPRAIPFQPASSWGRNYYDRRRDNNNNSHVRHNRWKQNRRWLQFLSRETKTHTSMEDQEAALLAMLMTENNNSNRGGPSRNKKKMIPRGKRDTPRRSSETASSFTVVARQFKSLEALDLSNSGVANQQQEADWMFLNSMAVEPTDDPNSYCCGIVDSLLGKSCSDDVKCHPKDAFLRLLKIVSRGNFAMCQMSKSNANNQIRMFPDWFDPEERWFTVSMYLACRLEVTLWDAFHQQSLKHCTRKPSNMLVPELQESHHSVFLSLLARATSDAIRSVLKDDRSTHVGNSYKNLFHVRDSLVWYLLRQDRCLLYRWNDGQVSWNNFSHSLLACPVLELGTKSEKFVSLIKDRMQFLVSDFVVQSMVQDQIESDDTSVTNNTTTMQAKKKSSKRRNQKRKNNKKKQNFEIAGKTACILYHNSEDDSFNHVSTPPVTKSPSSSDESGMDQESWSSYAFPDNNTSTRDRNRNIVIVLSILDDVIADVFELVGLNKLHTSEDYEVSTYGHDNQDHEFRLVQCKGKIFEVGKKSISLKQSKDESQPVHLTKVPTNEVSQMMKHSSKQSLPSLAMGVPKTTTLAVSSTKTTAPSKSESHTAWTFDINDHALFPSLHDNENLESDENFLSSFESHGTHEAENSATLRTSNLDGLPSGYPSLDPALFLRPDSLGSSGWDMPGYSTVDGWGRFRGFPRDESIFTDFFRSQDQKNDIQTRMVIASSTAASIASSTDEIESDPDKPNDVEFNLSHDDAVVEIDHSTISSSFYDHKDYVPPEVKFEIEEGELATPVSRKDGSESGSGFQSPSPPSTPSPRLSPILVSLSDLSAMRKEAIDSIAVPSARTLPSEPSPSLLASSQKILTKSIVDSAVPDEELACPAPKLGEDRVNQDKTKSPSKPPDVALSYKAVVSRPLRSSDDHDIRTKIGPRKSIGTSLSHQNISTRSGGKVSKDDHDIRHLVAREQSSFAPTYNGTVARATQTPTGRSSLSDVASKPFNVLHFEAVLRNKSKDGNLCTRSETALDGQEDSQRWSEIRLGKTTEDDNCTVAKDGSTTITSASSRKDTEELIILKEERNGYRDLCLTLGAEVAKLKNLLATTSNHVSPPTTQRATIYSTRTFGTNAVFDPDAMNNPFQKSPRAMTLAAMSDAGYRGDYESLASEEDIVAKTTPAGDHISSGVTVTESDASVDIASTRTVIQIPNGFQPVRDINYLVSMNGMQSRLTKDIFQFLATTNNQLKKLESKRRIAVQRMTRLVNAIWPRAQVKLYGSHVTGLCLPSSDLDFVVCLPAVHKNAVADAPGDLEGRNAINESSQKLLARRLKGESWIDPRSLKLIERTVVPIIKVSTKDTRAKTIHLDISFDAPHHHGLEAAHMISRVMEELPMVRPLVIVLKQFLLDRGLLTAYTGGLSSYCLFLMVARFLQEQTMMIDCGSLLMSFLDFYGNCFDPRSTGISVLHRQYFPRPNYAVQVQSSRPHMWGSIAQIHASKPSTMNHQSSFLRRNSFSDKGNSGSIFPRNQSASPQSAFHSPITQHAYGIPNAPPDTETHAMPYTFDPLFVEDPLAEGNNVGRNAFRIVQVQRCFSDAHRALSSALEWDMHSLNETQEANDFHLLKCLLQSEDVVFDL